MEVLLLPIVPNNNNNTDGAAVINDDDDVPKTRLQQQAAQFRIIVVKHGPRRMNPVYVHVPSVLPTGAVPVMHVMMMNIALRT